MIIYPAMDLMGGRVVRLRQGRFAEATAYAAEPREALEQFAADGASWAHVVDLDGTRAGSPAQHGLIAELAGATPLKLQVGGGIRSGDHVKRLLDSGVARVVVGSLAVRDPVVVHKWIEDFGPERISLALDVRMIDDEPQVAVSGWTEDSGSNLWDVAAQFPEARHLLLTDIGRDGEMRGPNFELLREAAERLPGVAVQASGGVSSLDDLRQLPTAGAIVGKALWEGWINLREAVRLASA